MFINIVIKNNNLIYIRGTQKIAETWKLIIKK